MNERPTGIAVIALFFILIGVFSLLWSGIIFGVGGLTSAVSGVFGADAVNSAASSGMWSGFLGIIAAAVQIVVGIGLLGMKSWSWYLAVIAIGLSVVQGFVGLFNGGDIRPPLRRVVAVNPCRSTGIPGKSGHAPTFWR